MGIKGIYKELGPGERVSLARLAAEKLAATGRPLRLAVDFSIWQFQAQAASGGSNPAIRTLFYRLMRLLGLGVHAVFVTDGPHKPQMKRHKRSGRGGDAISSAMGRELIELFGFVWHQAPGEAEAEAAMLQQMGLVDSVLSEDVDTIMFGCTETMRNWSPEKTKVGVPTHVTLYRVSADDDGTRGNVNGIDRYGMVLVAMMSGGDYEPEGIPGCGIKIACEAARAGFGRSLCMVKSTTPAAFKGWRKNLASELHRNESGFFRSRHSALDIPPDFPSVDTLQCYTHPVVSCKPELARKMRASQWGKEPDIAGLRAFAERTFDWATYATTVKFVNLLAPNLLVHRMLTARTAAARAAVGQLIHKIGNSRMHASTDKLTELRVSYVPNEIVKIDRLGTAGKSKMLPFSRDGLAINRANEADLGYLSDVPNSGDEAEEEEVLPKLDPSQPQLTWLLESLLEFGVPDVLAESRAAAVKKATKTKTTRKKKDKEVPEAGAMNKYVTTTKKTKTTTTKKDAVAAAPASPRKAKLKLSETVVEDTSSKAKKTKAKAKIDFDFSDSDADVDEPVVSPKRRRSRAAASSEDEPVISPKRPSRSRAASASEDDEPEPPRRRRVKATRAVEEEVEEVEALASPKRKCTPPKAKETSPSPTVAEAEDAPVISLLSDSSESPRKRSRSRKVQEVIVQAAESPKPVKRRGKASQVEDEDVSPTRKGRSSKIKDTLASLLTEEEDESPPKRDKQPKAIVSAEVVESPPSPKRRNPRASKAATEDVEPIEAKESSISPKRGRSRASKAATEDAEPIEAKEVSPSPPKRVRASKAATEDTELAESKESSPSSPKRSRARAPKAATEDAELVEAKESSPPPKRVRGRASKSATSDSEESLVEEEGESARKRGKQPKAAVPVEVKEPPPSPKRARGKASKADTSGAEEPLAEEKDESPRKRGKQPKATDVPIEAKEASPSPPKRRRASRVVVDDAAVPPTETEEPIAAPRQRKKPVAATEEPSVSPKKGRPPKSLQHPTTAEGTPAKRRKSSASSSASIEELLSLQRVIKPASQKVASTPKATLSSALPPASTQSRKSKQTTLDNMFSSRTTGVATTFACTFTSTTSSTTSTAAITTTATANMMPPPSPPLPPSTPPLPARSHSLCLRTSSKGPSQGHQDGGSAAHAILIPSSPSPDHLNRQPDTSTPTAVSGSQPNKRSGSGFSSALTPAPAYGEAASRRLGAAATTGGSGGGGGGGAKIMMATTKASSAGTAKMTTGTKTAAGKGVRKKRSAGTLLPGQTSIMGFAVATKRAGVVQGKERERGEGKEQADDDEVQNRDSNEEMNLMDMKMTGDKNENNIKSCDRHREKEGPLGDGEGMGPTWNWGALDDDGDDGDDDDNNNGGEQGDDDIASPSTGLVDPYFSDHAVGIETEDFEMSATAHSSPREFTTSSIHDLDVDAGSDADSDSDSDSSLIDLGKLPIHPRVSYPQNQHFSSTGDRDTIPTTTSSSSSSSSSITTKPRPTTNTITTTATTSTAKAKEDPPEKLTRIMLPRQDASGFYDTVHVTRAEAAALEEEEGHHRRRRRIVRLSDVSVVDLTGGD